MATCVQGDEEEAQRQNHYSPFGIPIRGAPVFIDEHQGDENVFCLPPFFGPLLFANKDSDARDHCANERSTSSVLLLLLLLLLADLEALTNFLFFAQRSSLTSVSPSTWQLSASPS
ncbi:hypothetical protein EG329_003462 [Mollisiaceae sp. DMI_Dod_QoI]|nr:hypothetical protein EG329_003462 [Helotiales sp. DMI_Dod_QoI]